VKTKMQIDPQIWDHTSMYVRDQLAIMARAGSAPRIPLTQEQINDLIYKVAIHPQEIANWNKKNSVITFRPQRKLIGALDDEYTENDTKNEPMFFRASFDFAFQRGGKLTTAFLSRLPLEWTEGNVVIDSRVHMLMPGWYPCIPGWHLDDIPRTRPDGQPDHSNPKYRSEHVCCIVGNASRTEFVDSIVTLVDVPVNEGVVYEKWSADIDKLVASGDVKTSQLNELEMVQFGWGDFHRGSAATKSGFRWFIRISRNTDLMPRNEIRQNANVYMSALQAGW
jgi:hypothetical protein